MFGYTFPIDPMMSSEDQAAYRAYYCETCHQLRDGYGVMSTVIVSYEMTFASIILNSVLDEGVIKDRPKNGKLCVLRHSDTHTELLRRLAAYSVLVANNGLVDDRMDGPSLKSNLALLWLNHSIDRARNDFPEYDELIMKGYDILREKEAAGCSDPLEMGRASAASMIWVLREMIGEKWTPELEELFENMGIWVYVLDAIEDLDDDHRKGQYNPFLSGCTDFTNGKEFISRNIYSVSEVINTVVSGIQRSYLKVREKMRANQSVTDNIIYQGIPVAVRRVMAGESKMQPSVRNLFSGRINRSIGSSF